MTTTIVPSNTELVTDYKLAVISPDEKSLATSFTQASEGFFCSIQDDGSQDSKISIYNAMNNVVCNFGDIQGHIEVSDMLAHNIELPDTITGEMKSTTRIVLIDVEGNGYQCTSKGIMSSVQKIISIVGQAPWTPAIKMKPKKTKVAKGHVLTIEIVK